MSDYSKEEKKDQELKAQYDSEIEREMSSEKWIKRASKYSDTFELHRPRSNPSQDEVERKRCNHWKASLNRLYDRYPGFRFRYTDYSHASPHDPRGFPHCTLQITIVPKIEIEVKPKPETKTDSSFSSFVHRRFTCPGGFQSHFE